MRRKLNSIIVVWSAVGLGLATLGCRLDAECSDLDPGCGPLAFLAYLPASGYPRAVFTANLTAGTISIFSVNPSSGELESAGVAAPSLPVSDLRAHPSQDFIYALNGGGITVLSLRYDASARTLTQTFSATSVAGAALSLHMHPTGNFVQVSDDAGSRVHTFNVVPDSYQATFNTTLLVGNNPRKLSYATIGGVNLVYVPLNPGGDGIEGYTFNTTTGALTPGGSQALTGFNYELLVRGELGWLLSGDGLVQPMQLDSFGSFVLTGAQVNPVASIQDCVLHPTLNIAYTINNATNLLTPLALTDNGATALSAQALATGISPFRIAISRNGKLLFVTSTGDNQLYVYRVDAQGVPTFFTSLSTGTNPQGVAALESR